MEPKFKRPHQKINTQELSHSLPRITLTPSRKFSKQTLPLAAKFKNYHEVSNSLEDINMTKSFNAKSLSPKKLPQLLPKLTDFSEFPFSSNKPTPKKEDLIKLDKFVIKSIKKPEFAPKSETLPDETPSKNTLKKSGFSNSRCPFANSEFFKDFFQENSKSESPIKKKNVIESKALEKLWSLFSSPVFSYVILDFQQKVQKVPQLSKYFQNVDITKIFQGKLDFFVRNIGKRDMSMHNRVLLENIHKKMNISSDDFNVFKGFFSIVMREHRVEEDLIADFLIFLENFINDIVSEANIFQKAYKDIPDFENILIDSFMDKINSNHLVSHYFANKDISFQTNHCKAVINYFLKEDRGDYDHQLRMSHKDCVITDHNFYYFKQCFQSSLREFRRENSKNGHQSLTKDAGKDLYFSQTDIFEIGDLFEEIRFPIMNQKSYFAILTESFKFEDIVSFLLSKLDEKPMLKEIFEPFSPEKVKRHAELLLMYVLGGPNKYTRYDMTPAHYNLAISLDHYEQMRLALDETLRNFKVNMTDRNYILAVLDSSKYEICNEKPLLKRIGGPKTIDYVINSFYLKAYQKSNLKGYFRNTDIKMMIANQKFWFAKFFENSCIKPYHFKDLRTFHLGMEITEEAFSYFVKTLVEGLKEFGFKDERVIKEAVGWLNRTKGDILDLKNE